MADPTRSTEAPPDFSAFGTPVDPPDFSDRGTPVDPLPPDFSDKGEEVTPIKPAGFLRGLFDTMVQQHGSAIRSDIEAGKKVVEATALNDKPLVKFSPLLFVSPVWGVVAPEVAAASAKRAAELASGLTSPQALTTIGGATLAGPAVAGPVFSALGTKIAAEAAGRGSVALGQGDLPAAAAEGVETLFGLSMVPGAVGPLRALRKAREVAGDKPPVIKPGRITPEEQRLAQEDLDLELGQEPTRTKPDSRELETPIKIGEGELPLTPPPPENPPPRAIAPTPKEGGDFTVDVSEKPPDISSSDWIHSPQWQFYFGRMGPTAKQAWETVSLGEMKLRERTGRDVDLMVGRTLEQLPKEMREKGAKAFVELLDSRNIEEIASEWLDKPGGADVAKAATMVKSRLEEIRGDIRDTLRAKDAEWLSKREPGELAAIYESKVEKPLDPALKPKEIVQEITEHEYPQDWGISDGRYFPHLFSGEWKITTADGKFVGRATTPFEAKVQLRELVASNPDMAGKGYRIFPEVMIPADMIRLTDRQFGRQLGQISKYLEVDAKEVAAAERGVIGRKSTKEKFFGFRQKREGAQNWERDYAKAMTAYLYGSHRWKVLSELQREVQPLIEKVVQERRPQAALRLEALMKNLWGTPKDSTLLFDNLVRSIPVVGEVIKPLALERWMRSFRGLATTAALTTARFAALNRLQPLQGLYPLLGERAIVEAKLLQHSAEGRALLEKHGIIYDQGTWGEPGLLTKWQKFRERLTGEKSNQELAFLAMYQHGLKTGLGPDAAASYAKLRGQVMTQFMPLISDTPRLLEGPVMGTIFQFKRFPIKQLELLATMATDRNVPALARFVGAMSAMGGLAYWLKQAWSDDPARMEKIRKGLVTDYGEPLANLILFGLPGWLGTDMTGSLVMGDAPFGDTLYEKLGRTVVGPAGSMALRVGEVVTKDQRQPTTPEQRLATILRAIPALKPLGELVSMGDLDVRTPDGEVAMRRNLTDALVALGSFRGVNEANVRIHVDGVMAALKEKAEVKNAAWVAEEGGDDTKADRLIEEFNQRWPELHITGREWATYRKTRRTGMGKTDVERRTGKKFLESRPASQGE